MQQGLAAPTTRSRLAIAELDGRSSQARKFKDVLRALAEDVGGVDNLTPRQSMTLRTAASLQFRIEELQAQIVRGESLNTGELTKLTGIVSRLLAGLRTVRKPQPPAPRFGDAHAA
jgi:hypothetical protein